MDAVASFYQASDCQISITHYVNNSLIGSITQAKYQIFDRNGIAVVTKTLGNGLSFSNGVVTVTLSDLDTLDLNGSYKHQCAVRDPAGKDIFILDSTIRFKPTKVRL